MSDTQWYVAINGSPRGPILLWDLQVAAAAGEINDGTLVWTTGLADWRHASEVDGLLPRSNAPGPRTVEPTSLPPLPAADLAAGDATRLGVWACLAIAGMHALGGLASLLLKTGFLSFERLTHEQAFVSATNNMAVAVAFLAIAYLYDAKGHVLVPILGLLLFGAEVVAKIGTGHFEPVWMVAYSALTLLFAASVKVKRSLRRH